MKAYLMHRDRDFDVKRASAANETLLLKDLELETLLLAMAVKDQLVYDVAKKALFTGVGDDLDTVEYRQSALRDCLDNPSTIRQIYALAEEAFQRPKRVWGHFREFPSGLLSYSVEIMGIYIDVLKRLRRIADEVSPRFKSAAFSNLFTTLASELDDEYFAIIDRHLKRLKFRSGVLVSAELGNGLKGSNYILRRPLKPLGSWFTRIFADRSRSYTLWLAPRDEAGANAMSELRDRGVGLAADALAKSAEHILSFFDLLRTELAFYVGCLNLHGRLEEVGAPSAFPRLADRGAARFSCTELYDICLALSTGKRPVGNEIKADGKSLIIVTGANQGGKTTFLRSAGLAQLMAQCGMFAPAAALSVNAVNGVFTHFKHEEDATMSSGKFDEELSRMNDIVNILTPDALILFNESFAATNEREGSEIGRQIVSALLEQAHKVVFVSHQYDFAHGFFERSRESALFLRADRQADGRRTFRLVEGEPLTTSFGEDVYREVFREEASREPETADGESLAPLHTS